MKQIFLTLTLLLLPLLTAGAVKKFNVNPINLAITLVEKADSLKVASFLEYYGYTPKGTEDGYTIMKHPNGNELRFSFTDTQYPTIIVKTTDTHKAIGSRLESLNFEKTGKGYEQIRNKYSKYKTVCNFGPKSTMLVRRVRTSPILITDN